MITDKGKDLKKLVGLFKKLKKVKIEVGIPASVGVNPETGTSIVEYAYYNECGLGVPERSFLKSTAETQESKWSELMLKAYDHIVEGDEKNTMTYLNKIGQLCANDVVEKIESDVPPKNSPATIAKKGSEHTLIDTGFLKKSIAYEVKS